VPRQREDLRFEEFVLRLNKAIRVMGTEKHLLADVPFGMIRIVMESPLISEEEISPNGHHANGKVPQSHEVAS